MKYLIVFLFFGAYHVKFGIVGMRMDSDDWVIAGSVVGDEEGPPPAITLVLVAAMEHIAVEEQSISRLHLYLYQWQNLETTIVSQ